MGGIDERPNRARLKTLRSQSYRDSAGKKKQIWRKVDSGTEARRVLREIENELEHGTESFENRDTLGEYLDKWLATSKQKVYFATLAGDASIQNVTATSFHDHPCGRR